MLGEVGTLVVVWWPVVSDCRAY